MNGNQIIQTQNSRPVGPSSFNGVKNSLNGGQGTFNGDSGPAFGPKQTYNFNFSEKPEGPN